MDTGIYSYQHSLDRAHEIGFLFGLLVLVAAVMLFFYVGMNNFIITNSDGTPTVSSPHLHLGGGYA